MSFVEEIDLLGTSGAKALTWRYTSSFFMTNCDILIEEDYPRSYSITQGQLEYHYNGVRREEFVDSL